VTAVSDRFATVEDLVPACGDLAMRHMHMPPPEEAPSLFAGQSDRERLETLVALLFDLYDRAAPLIERLRSEADALPVLGHGRAAFEEVLDGLVAGALGAPPDPRTLALVRALTGMPVWRAVRTAGTDDAAAVAALAAALEVWPAGVPRG
jgi:hypothetical protein